jgi:hypothetical protein
MVNSNLLYTYGFIIDKNLDERIDVFVPKVPRLDCDDSKKLDSCKYKLFPYEINADLLRHFRAAAARQPKLRVLSKSSLLKEFIKLPPTTEKRG